MMPMLLLILIIRRDQRPYSFQPTEHQVWKEDVFISAHLTERLKRTVSVVFTSCRIFTLRLFRSQPFYWPLEDHVPPLWPPGCLTHPAWGYFENVQIIRYHARSGTEEHQEIFLGGWEIFGECSQLSETMGLDGVGVGYLKFKIEFCFDQGT